MKNKYNELANKFVNDDATIYHLNSENLLNLNVLYYVMAKKNVKEFINVIELSNVLEQYLIRAKKILIPKLENLNQIQEVLNILSKKLLTDDTLIEVMNNDNISETDIIILELAYKLNINFPAISGRKKLLIKDFIKKIENDNLSHLSILDIRDKVAEACQHAKSTDGITMNTTQALRYMHNIEFSKINPKFDNIQQCIRELYKNEQVSSEFYHLEQNPDKHFHMVKVTGKNAQQWKSYITEQENYQKKDSDDGTHKNIGVGHTGFTPMLGYHDQDLTDVWVAFFANKKITNSNDINFKDIEIAVTVDTSKNSTFISPCGIARNINYEGVEHKNLAPEFFSCIAKIIQEHYTEKHNSVPKFKFINQPAEIMQEILIKSFANFGSFFIGDNRNDDYINSSESSEKYR